MPGRAAAARGDGLSVPSGMWGRGSAALLMVAALALLSCATARRNDARKPVSGARLYRVSCSGCHGLNARGNGPVAPFLKVPVPDLTLVAARRGGAFPDDEVYRIIDGQSDLQAHGPRHMPVWGYEFFGDDADDEVAHRQATQRVDLLVSYLRSIQRAE